ncbi:MAG: sulfurtransferase [Gammaproteobacteria bacterium]|nr:sulfurtransferase [Gammaproteobacteria bacterium]
MIYDTLIQSDELLPRLGDTNWLIFDCRFDLADTAKGETRYRQSHIPGAIYAHLDRQLSSPITPASGRHPLPLQADLVRWLAECGLRSDTQVVVYDDCFGAMASRLWWLLKCLGHQSVALLDGGWQAWQGQSLAEDARLPLLSPSAFNAAFDLQYMVDTDAVLDNLQTRQFQLIDVRSAERFSGKLEPIDPVAGHIPGALNRPLSDNLDARGLFKPAQALQDYYAPLQAEWTSQQQVFMCGSGVTACHSVLAMVIAGYQMPRLYTGSWSEWIRDSAHPVETSL